MKIIDIIKVYTNTFRVFEKYLVDTYKINTKEYLEKIANGMLLLQVVKFLEEVYKIDMLDAVSYMSLYSKNKNNYIELLKDTVEHCLWRIENKRTLDFTIF